MGENKRDVQNSSSRDRETRESYIPRIQKEKFPSNIFTPSLLSYPDTKTKSSPESIPRPKPKPTPRPTSTPRRKPPFKVPRRLVTGVRDWYK